MARIVLFGLPDLKMRSLKAFLVTMILLAPHVLEACSVCGGANSPLQTAAYLNTTFLLAGMPMVIGAAVFFWIYKKSKTVNELS